MLKCKNADVASAHAAKKHVVFPKLPPTPVCFSVGRPQTRQRTCAISAGQALRIIARTDPRLKPSAAAGGGTLNLKLSSLIFHLSSLII